VRRCSHCGKNKPDEAFSFRNRERGTRNSRCRACKTEYNKAWYADNSEQHKAVVVATKRSIRERNRQWLLGKRARLVCNRCGEADQACLDFHHREPNGKEYALSEAIRRGWSLKRLEAELAKCDVLCSNCHRKHHAEARSSSTA
jgi:hypothetical protein